MALFAISPRCKRGCAGADMRTVFLKRIVLEQRDQTLAHRHQAFFIRATERGSRCKSFFRVPRAGSGSRAGSNPYISH